MEVFQNLPVDLNSLPNAEQVPLTKVSELHIRKGLIRSAIFFLAVLVPLITMNIFYGSWGLLLWLTVWLGYSAALALDILYTFRHYPTIGYALRDLDIIYQSGLFFRSKTVLPLNRIQHLELKQGPIDRKFQLATLIFYGAGGTGADLAIESLPIERANEVRQFVLGKINEQ